MTLWPSSQPPWALSLFFLLIGAYQKSWRGKTFIKLWKMQITAYICKYGCLSFDENINLYCHIKMWITGFKSKFASFLENVVVYHLMNIIINLDWYRFRWTEIDTNASALAFMRSNLCREVSPEMTLFTYFAPHNGGIVFGCKFGFILAINSIWHKFHNLFCNVISLFSNSKCDPRPQTLN